MGGCRCVFRDCKVGTSRNPGMHFFRFPKRGKNLNDWIRFSGLENYMKLTESQQRNKVICGRHFKDSCFMNYKQERLIPTAVPTITRLNTEWALDYEQDLQNPKLIKIGQPKAQHLISPPEFKDPQCFNSHDLKFAADVLKYFKNSEVYYDEAEIGHKRLKVMETQNTEELVVTKETFTDRFLESLASDDRCEMASAILESDWAFNSDNFNEQTESSKNKLEDCANCLIQSKRIKELEAILETKSKEINEITAKLENRDAKLSDTCKEMNQISECTEKMKLKLFNESKVNLQLKTQITDLSLKYNKLLQTHGELEKQHEHIRACLAKQETISSKIETPKPQRELAHPLQLSKQQLFNGIKRYLSQTMIALLRMQLSSCSAERDWKPDEKRVALDLLSLGEHVYKYFTDEWLLRLPGIHSVSNWCNQIESQDDEDEL